MKMAFVLFIVASMLSSVSAPTSSSSSRRVCPANTHQIADHTCIYVKRSRHHYECEQLRRSFNLTEKACEKLTIGGLKWRLPKIDSRKKLVKTAHVLIHLMDESSDPHKGHDDHQESHNDLYGTPWIWIGLRRWNQTNKAPSDESGWYWTADNTTMSLRNNLGEDFWKINEPNNDAENEFCAIAIVFRNEKKEWERLQFADIFCENPAEINQGMTTIQPGNFLGLACQAEIPKPKAKEAESSDSVVDEWWFYLICALLLIVPIVVIVVVLAIYCRGRDKDRRQRSPRKDKKRNKRTKVDEEDGSLTGEQYSSIGSQPIIRTIRPKIGYVPPPMPRSPPDSKHSSDEESGGIRYSNLRPKMSTPDKTKSHEVSPFKPKVTFPKKHP